MSDWSPSPETITCACQGDLPEIVLRGFDLFDQREFFDAHEVLEEAWRDETGPIRELYRGILQIAVAYLHIQRGNYPGAWKMFQRANRWLDPFPDHCRGVDLAQFRQDYRLVEESLRRLGPERIDLFDAGLFKVIPIRK